MRDRTRPFVMSPGQQAVWPKISGNKINGLGEDSFRRPTPVFWQDPSTIVHGPVFEWYVNEIKNDPELWAARQRRRDRAGEDMANSALNAVAASPVQRSPEEWANLIKSETIRLGANQVGITRMKDDWVYDNKIPPKGRYIIVFVIGHDYDAINSAPSTRAGVEIHNGYEQGRAVAQGLANWFRDQGHLAELQPVQGNTVLLIPPAIECGFGNLGKHGSIINDQFGSAFRLDAVFVDVDIVCDSPSPHDLSSFCINCKACTDACPPEAISNDKQIVRGVEKWYVDFDRCVPYMMETHGCGICLGVCPYSRPGVGQNLVAKMLRK